MDKEELMVSLLNKCYGWTFRIDDGNKILDMYKFELNQNKKYKEIIARLTNFILDLDDETDNAIYDIESSCRNDILDILKEVG